MEMRSINLDGLSVVSLMETTSFQHGKSHPCNLLCVSGTGTMQTSSGAISVTDRLHLWTVKVFSHVKTNTIE